jgi:hypothetical protein
MLDVSVWGYPFHHVRVLARPGLAELAGHSTVHENLIVHVRGEMKNITGSLFPPLIPKQLFSIMNSSSACCDTDERTP